MPLPIMILTSSFYTMKYVVKIAIATRFFLTISFWKTWVHDSAYYRYRALIRCKYRLLYIKIELSDSWHRLETPAMLLGTHRQKKCPKLQSKLHIVCQFLLRCSLLLGVCQNVRLEVSRLRELFVAAIKRTDVWSITSVDSYVRSQIEIQWEALATSLESTLKSNAHLCEADVLMTYAPVKIRTVHTTENVGRVGLIGNTHGAKNQSTSIWRQHID